MMNLRLFLTLETHTSEIKVHSQAFSGVLHVLQPSFFI